MEIYGKAIIINALFGSSAIKAGSSSSLNQPHILCRFSDDEISLISLPELIQVQYFYGHPRKLPQKRYQRKSLGEVSGNNIGQKHFCMVDTIHFSDKEFFKNCPLFNSI